MKNDRLPLLNSAAGVFINLHSDLSALTHQYILALGMRTQIIQVPWLHSHKQFMPHDKHNIFDKFVRSALSPATRVVKIRSYN